MRGRENLEAKLLGLPQTFPAWFRFMNAVTYDNQTAVRKKRKIDLAKPTGISLVVIAMLPLVIMPLLSIFVFGFSKGPVHFWKRW